MKIFIVSSHLNVAVRPLDFWFDNIWISSRGLTGSDLGFVRIAQALQQLGHDVSLFTVHAQPNNKPDQWENIKLFNMEDYFTKIKENENDLGAIISINDPNIFFNITDKPLKILVEYLNDFPFARPGWEDKIDIGLGACEQHTNYLKTLVAQPDKWQPLHLGCNPELYEDKRVPGRIIWCSSADRGLMWLLQEYSKIKEAVPYASLRIFYHFGYGDNILNVEPNSTTNHPHIIEMGNRIRYCKEAIKKLEPLDVQYVGSISRKQMVEEFSKASVFGYSCDTISFSEGFSCSTLEAHASYTVPVITSQDCLGSIYQNSGAIVIPTPIQDNIGHFTSTIIRALTDQTFADTVIDQCMKFAKENTWTVITKKLEQMILNHPKYKSTNE